MADVTLALSRRLRHLRAERGMSLRAVASLAQVSPSLLSQIERGDVSPSLLSLVAIADALQVRPGHLLDDPERPEERSPVVRRAQRHVIDDPLCRREYLMHLDDPYLEVAELSLAPGGSSRPSLAAHSGRDYGVVLAGAIVVQLSSGREILREGDYIAFGAETPHRIVNESGRDARAAWIVAHGQQRIEADAASGVTGGGDPATRASEPAPGRPESPRARAQLLGIRLRELRVRRGLTLRGLADRAEVSASLLSQIERGEASPSLLSLAAIAHALAVRPADLLEAVEQDPHSPVVRRAQRRVIEDPRCRREYMMELDDPYLHVAELTISPRSASRPSAEPHSGRDYGLVLSGTVTLELGGRRERLRSGDYVAFDARRPHRLLNETGRRARMLWITAPAAGY